MSKLSVCDSPTTIRTGMKRAGCVGAIDPESVQNIAKLYDGSRRTTSGK